MFSVFTEDIVRRVAMRHITSRQALVGGAIALGALAALRSVANARERRHKISQGVLRPAESLGRYLNVYAPDLPGDGKTAPPRKPLDVSELAEALIAWMDASGIECASLVGNSMGCQVAVEAALRHPSRNDQMVLIGPTTDPRGRSVSQLMMRFLIGGLFEQPSLNWLLDKDYARMRSRLIKEFNVMRADEVEVKLPHVDVPTMLVRGE